MELTTDLAHIYNFYYLHFIYNLINKRKISYFWWTAQEILDNVFIRPERNKEWNKEEYAQVNHYLYINNSFELAQDLFNNGMYLPFLITSCKNSWHVDLNDPNIITKKVFLILGFHRAYALCNNANINSIKKFLFLDIGYHINENIIIPTYQKSKTCPYNFILTMSKDSNEINNNLWSFQEMISNANNELTSPLLQNNILNDEKLFNMFITSPWEHFEREYCLHEKFTTN